MTVRKMVSIASLLGALSLVGCGDSANQVCDECQVQDLRGECEEFYNVCIQDDAGEPDDCAVGALAQCGIL